MGVLGFCLHGRKNKYYLLSVAGGTWQLWWMMCCKRKEIVFLLRTNKVVRWDSIWIWGKGDLTMIWALFLCSLQNKIWNLPDRSTILPIFIYDKEGKLARPTQILPVRVRGPALILKTVYVTEYFHTEITTNTVKLNIFTRSWTYLLFSNMILYLWCI